MNINEKREEIREGIAQELSFIDKSNQWNNLPEHSVLATTGGMSKHAYRCRADMILARLDTAGCVLKVERELPKLGDYDKRRTTSESVDFQDGFIVAKIAMRKAGYVAVEPLIEEKA